MIAETSRREASSTASDPFVGRDMLCFSHDWTGDPLSKTHLMRLLAKRNRILWVNSLGYRTPSLKSGKDLRRIFAKLRAAAEPVREVEKNIFVLNPLAIPAWGNSLARRVNSAWLRRQITGAMRRLGFQRPTNWVFNPVAGALAGRLGEDRIIYYCVDEYTEFSGVDKSGLAAIERDLLAKADLTIVSARRLFDNKSPLTKKTVLVRHGVDFEHFRKALSPETKIPDEIAALPRPIIGFFGLIADWVDIELMAKLAQRHSTGTLVLLGKASTDVSGLTALPNVRWLGRREYSELPAFCKGFDVALNPFRLNELTLNANPLKVREYLAAGLPVVSTELPEVAVLRHCRTATTHDEFLAAVDDALVQPGPREEISDSVRHEGWSARLDEIAEHFATPTGELR